MTSGVADMPETVTADDYRTTEATCLACVTTLSLDDDEPKLGTVSWRIASGARWGVGVAVSFQCRRGHSSNDDAQLLKAFPSRRFW